MDTITRQDQYFDAMSGGSSEIPEPITRKEQYYAKMAGEDIEVPEPVTREEYWLHKIIEHGGGGGTTTIEPLTVTENGSYSETGKAYSPVNVNVPNSYTASDEGKVVSNGALVAQSSQNIDTNGTYDTTLKNEVVVNVSGGGDTRCISGIFNYDTAGVFTIDLPYEGNGVPFGIIICYELGGGASKTGVPSNNIMALMIVKDYDSIPTEGSSTTYRYSGYRRRSDYGTLKWESAGTGALFFQGAPNSTMGIDFLDNTHMRVNIASGSQNGYMTNTNYRYCVLYTE